MRALLLLLLVPWTLNEPTVPLADRFPTPTGFERVDVDAWGAFLRALPVVEGRTVVRTWDGTPLGDAAAVIALDVGRPDLQQCADTILRLRGEFLWAAGRAESAAFHFTSGDRSAWPDWRDGERFEVDGAQVRRVRGAPGPDDHGNFRAWMQHLFRYAGTRSLARDTRPADGALRPGDVFAEPGSPGHAVVLLDVAQHGDRRVGLVAQGFTPAQEAHVLDGPLRGWFPLPGPGEALVVPSWRPFPRDDARRFVDD